MKARKKSPPKSYLRHMQPDGTWDIDSMSHAELDALAAECEKMKPGSGRALNRKERAEFEAWQKKALAEEAAEEAAGKRTQSLTLVFPTKLVTQIGELAKQKHTTPAILVKRIVQDAIHQAVA